MGALRYRLRSWSGARWRTLAALTVIVAITGGVALTLVAGAVRTLTAPDRYVTAWGSDHDVSVEQDSGPPRIRELARLDAVRSVEMATFVFGGLDAGDVGQADALVFAGSPGATNTRVVEGRATDPSKPNEFVATPGFVEASGMHLGSTVELGTFTQAQADALGFEAGSPEGPSLTATLVGVISGPGLLTGDAYEIALFPASLLDIGDVGVSASEAAIALAPGATMGELRTEINTLDRPNEFSVERAEIVAKDVRDAANVQGQGLAVLAIIVSLAVITVLGQLATRQFRIAAPERGVLRSLGYTRGQLGLEQGMRTATIAITGAGGAAALAYLASSSFPIGFAKPIEPHPGRRFDLAVHGLGAVTLALALLVWVLASSIAGSRRPREGGSPGLVERLLPSFPNPKATTALRFAFGSSTEKGASPGTPLAGLVVVLIVLFGALTFGTNLRRLIGDPSTYGVNFDIGLGQGGDEIPDEAQAALSASPDVAAFALYGVTSLQIDTQSLAIVGFQPVKGDLRPEILRGRFPVGDDEVALGPVAARHLGLDIGDRVKGTSASGPQTLRVTGLALVPGVGGADVLGDVALVDQVGFSHIDPEATLGQAGVLLAKHARAGAPNRISKLTGMDAGGQFDPPAAISNLDRIRGIPWIVALAVGVLSVLSLGHLMLVAVPRHRRDFAILRAIGAPRRWLTELVHWQATLTAALLLGLSVPLGGLAGAGIYQRFADDLGARPDSVLPLRILAVGLVALLLLSNAVAALAAHRVRRDQPSVVLGAG